MIALFGAFSLFAYPVAAEGLQALARVEPGASKVSSGGPDEARITLGLTQAVPFRVLTLSDPARVILDFRDVNFAGLKADTFLRTRLISDMRVGVFQPGWSRMVLLLEGPMNVTSAAMNIDENRGTAELKVVLRHTTEEAFRAENGSVNAALWRVEKTDAPLVAKTRPDGERPIVVALDPGHGGIDPGAQHQGHDEATLMLKLAREMKERLVLSGKYEVFLTRDEDVFVSLPERVRIARARGADVFLSLHADALSTGSATGTTVYSLSDQASDQASDELARAQDHHDLLAGVDLSEQEDLIAVILMDMARVETKPRSEHLADQLVDGIAESVGRIRSRPRLSAGFSVLKAPDIPSVLIEFGFMSNPRDLANLANPDWRRKAIEGVLMGLDRWAIRDAAEGKLLRQ